MKFSRIFLCLATLTLCFSQLSAFDDASTYAKAAMGRPDGWLSFYNTHTGESLRVQYVSEAGQWVPAALERLNYFFRCHTDGKFVAMNPRLFVVIDTIQDHFGADKTIQIISGYRSPELNAVLHARSSGVAKHSRHMCGEAIDIRIPGVPAREVYKYAWNLQQGGVGCYTGSNFVHVDVGPVRTWGI